MKLLGADIGSATIKAIFLDDDNNLVFSLYERHFSYCKETI